MKRREVIKRIERQAVGVGAVWIFARQGANHEVYLLNGVMIPIARHSEFGNRAAEMIWKECELVFGKGWWR